MKNVLPKKNKKAPAKRNKAPQSERGKSLSESSDAILSNDLWLKILIGMFAGIVLGYILSPESFGLLSPETANTIGSWVALPGTIFISLLQMIVVPLVVVSIILGITTSGDIEFLKKIGLRIVPYFIGTTAISITIGLTLVYLIRPGDYIDQTMINSVLGEANPAQAPKTFEDLTVPQRIANLIPTNLSQAFLDKNLLQIVIFSIMAGVAMIMVPKRSVKPVENLCVGVQVLVMQVISWAMLIAPYAVFGLLCQITIKIGLSAIYSMGVYVFTVLIGLICMYFAYIAIVTLIAGRNPLTFIRSIIEAQMIAFSTSSSAATMPISIKVAEEKMGIDPKVSRFVIPLGATINMDGTALYQAVAAIFLYQIFGPTFSVELSFFDIVLLLITTVGASIGTPAVPGVGIVVLATILIGIGIDPVGIALILGVDRILDMCRTTINVTGDLTAATVMQRWLKLEK